MTDGPFYNHRTRDWVMVIDARTWEDADGNVRHFVTAADAREAAEVEVYGPRRARRDAEAQRRRDGAAPAG